MKHLCKTIYIMLISCIICTCVVGCGYTADDMGRAENSSSGYVTEQEENEDKREFHFLNADEVEGISDFR